MLKIDIGKYRNIIISVALFLLFDMSVLVLNFFISFQIADDASSVNLAGRQRMLSQRMTKSLFDMEYNFNDLNARETVRGELQLSRNLFDSTFTAFDTGSEVMGAGGTMVDIKKPTDAASLAALDNARMIWVDYRQKIDRVINSNANSIDGNNFQREFLSDAIFFGRENNLKLLTYMNDLTVALEAVASSRANNLRLIQTAGILLALINFFFILFHFVRQLREGDKVIEDAKKETDDILATVNEGLFLVREDFSIGDQRSEKLYDILNIGRNEAIGLDQILNRIVSEKDADDAHGFLRILFNKKVKEKLIHNLNPLDKVEVNIDNGSGNYETKFLSFSFNRIVEEGEIIELLVTVNDITEQTLLEQQLQIEKEKNDNQITMLTSVLHTNPSILKTYLNNAFDSFSKINNLLKKPGKKQEDFKAKINEIFVIVHNFKGESSALSLTDFANMAHDFEEQLTPMRQSNSLTGQDFLSLTVQLDKLINYAQSITGLIEQLADLTQAATANREEKSEIVPINNDWQHLQQLVSNLCIRQNKEVTLVTSGLQEQQLTSELREVINSICIQFIRNAIVHGIEAPAEREMAEKSPQGRIDIRLSSTTEGMLELVIRDDGEGINADKIREVAIASGQWLEEEIIYWDQKQLFSLIFSPGFSTQTEADEDAGRGVGMDIIRQQIKSQKGKIKISTRKNIFSCFVITFPLYMAKQAA